MLGGKLGDTALSSLLGLQAARAKLEGARAAPKLEGGARTAKVMPPLLPHLLLRVEALLTSFSAVGGWIGGTRQDIKKHRFLGHVP